MRTMEFAIDGISPTDFAPWNGAKVFACITVVEETMRVRVELPPPADSLMERLKEKFEKLVPKSGHQRDSRNSSVQVGDVSELSRNPQEIA